MANELGQALDDALASVGKVVELMRAAEIADSHPDAWDCVWAGWTELEKATHALRPVVEQQP